MSTGVSIFCGKGLSIALRTLTLCSPFLYIDVVPLWGVCIALHICTLMLCHFGVCAWPYTSVH